MRDALIIFVALIMAIVIGGLLYLYGGPAWHDLSVTKSPSGIPITVLGAGTTATAFDQRVNYRITNSDDFKTLWQMVYSNSGPSIPLVDFSTQEVIGVFDGSHSSGGFSVKITDVSDTGGQRVIHILRTAPGVNCPTSNALTSPFQIVQLPKSPLSLTHVDEMATASCSQ